MRTYECFWRGKRWTCEAVTSRQAQALAADYWKVAPRKVWEITVVLADKPIETGSL